MLVQTHLRPKKNKIKAAAYKSVLSFHCYFFVKMKGKSIFSNDG